MKKPILSAGASPTVYGNEGNLFGKQAQTKVSVKFMTISNIEKIIYNKRCMCDVLKNKYWNSWCTANIQKLRSNVSSKGSIIYISIKG